ncbi:MAG: putative Ca2+/H+ antiporter, family [candidate division NC10 bacterium]|nr:putative Ca2+/H+ antiporter, family [candidate division NC10 bacterium]MBS1117302.1 putative Ca2+/H+ antiporter, family [candidate division NC10 bacterium]
MVAFLPSLLFVTLAEMGDKTQLLAMAFATRFPARTVLSAVFAATLVNHALAVAAGRILTNVIPLDAISLAAALSFILFGLWTLRGDTLEGEDQQRSSYGPFLTVAVAFFLAELGDKTQLATISLAVRYSDAVAVLLGTTAAMVIADSIGIGIGIVMGRRLPDALIRIVSAGVFVFFGLAGASSVLTTWLPLAVSSAVLFALAVATLGAAHYLIVQRRRLEAQPQRGRAPRGFAERLPQSLFALLLAVAWVASLGLAKPLAAFDHWITFVLLGGLGWKLIHGVVRPDRPAVRLDARLVCAVLILAALTSAQAFLVEFHLALAIVPVLVLLAALALLLGGPFLTRRADSPRLQRIGQHRIEIASGLVLIGIALKTLIEHMA